jgi:hypothetical protein
MQYQVVHNQQSGGLCLLRSKSKSKLPSETASASTSGGRFYFICTYQVGFAMSDVGIYAELALRGAPAAKEVFAARAAKRRRAASYQTFFAVE